MLSKAKSQLEKDIIRCRKHDTLMAWAVEAYRSEMKKLQKDCAGLRTICRNLEKENLANTGEPTHDAQTFV